MLVNWGGASSLGVGFRTLARFTRPSNVTPYTVGATVGASGTAGAVHRLAAIGPVGAHYEIHSVDFSMTGTALPSGMAGGFRVHFYTAEPIAAADNAPFTGNLTERLIHIGYIDLAPLELVGGGFLRRVNNTDKLRFQSILPDVWAEIVTLTGNGFTPVSGAQFELDVRGAVVGAQSTTEVALPWLVNNVYRQAEQTPAASWDFAKNRSLTDSILNLVLPFTRTTTSTFNQADNTLGTAGINEPIFSFFGGASRGLEIWEARVNEFLNSDAPVTQTRTVTAAIWTLSFKGTGSITLTGASTAGPLNGTGVSDRVQLGFTPSAGALTLTLSGSVREVQLELGAGASPYIPTGALPASRAGDVCLLPDISSFYVPGGGFYVEFISPPAGAGRNIAVLSDGTSDNRIALLVSGGSAPNLNVTTGAATQAGVFGASVTPGQVAKVAARFLPDDVAISLNGGSLVTDTSTILPTVNQLRLGASATGNLAACTTIARLDYYQPGAFQAFLQRMSA